MKHLVLFAFSSLLFIPVTHAQAAAAPAAPAQKTAAALEPNVEIFKNQLEGIIENQKASSERNGCQLITKGTISVEKANGYYAFTLPMLTYSNANGARTELGMIAINAVPDADQVNWKVSAALPTPIKRFSPNGKVELVRTEIGTQNISGVWNVKLGRFTSLNGVFKNVSQNFLQEKTLVTIETLTATEKLGEIKPNTWSGPVSVIVDNMTAYNDKMKYKGVWPKITMDANVTNMAADKPLTSDDIAKRPATDYRDYYNLLSLSVGEPGTIHSTVVGFDDVVAKLQQATLTAKQENKSTFMGANVLMAGLNAIGKKDPAQPSVRIYDTVFGPGGSVLLNGIDLQKALSIPY